MNERRPYDTKEFIKKLKREKRELQDQIEELQVQLSERPEVPMYHEPVDMVIELDKVYTSSEGAKHFYRQLHSVWFYIKWRWHTRKASWRKEG